MSSDLQDKRIVVGITGASGAIYGRRLLQCLVETVQQVDLVVTPHGMQLLKDELQVSELSDVAPPGMSAGNLTIHACADVGAAIASGSTLTSGMVVCPASSNTMAKIASGIADNLLLRAAQVTLKERRRLVLVPREMPISHLDLENYLRLSGAGAVICPASPAFYMKPESIADLVDFVVGRVLDFLGIKHQLNTRWQDMLEKNK